MLYLPSILGGLLVGTGVSVLLFGSGRIAGVSGLLGGLLDGARDRAVGLAFVGAMIGVGVLAAWLAPSLVPVRPAPLGVVAAAGLLVGYGTRLGNGCTSGHGVCGVSRFSPRSMLATTVFVGVGMLTVYAARLVGSAL